MVEDIPKYIAFIPVRGGSKSIPLKNINKIAGRPLLYWVIDAAVGCDRIDQVYVSTDSTDIRLAVDNYIDLNKTGGKLICTDRHPSTATDTASTESAMIDFSDKHGYQNIILIQATSPLLSSGDLEKGIDVYEAGGFDSLISAVRQKRFLWSKEEDGSYRPTNYDFMNRPRRQEFGGYLVENGAFYITSKEQLEKTGNRISGQIGLYEMNEETYYEIDEPADWIIAENLLNKKIKACNVHIPAIKLFVTDCDGVLTDGGMIYTEHGDEGKKFSTYDGMGFALLHQNGIKTAIITGEDTVIVSDRAKKIKADYLYQGIWDKLTVLRSIIENEGIKLSEVAYIGDDINDIECMKLCGISFTVPNAVDAVKEVADCITVREGGHGAVRESIDHILESIRNG